MHRTLAVFSLFPVALCAAGLWGMQWESQVLAHRQTMPVLVLDTQVRYQPALPSGGGTYAPVIHYAYTLEGKPYHSTQYALPTPPWLNLSPFLGCRDDIAFATELEARVFLANYTPGKPAIGYYDRRDPTRVFLDKKPVSKTARAFVIGFLTGVIFLVAVFGLSKWHARHP